MPDQLQERAPEPGDSVVYVEADGTHQIHTTIKSVKREQNWLRVRVDLPDAAEFIWDLHRPRGFMWLPLSSNGVVASLMTEARFAEKEIARLASQIADLANAGFSPGHEGSLQDVVDELDKIQEKLRWWRQ